MPSFSLKWMLAGVAAVALGCVALLYASRVAFSITLAVALLLLLTAPLGIVNRTGARRAFWVGFAVFGWCYFLALMSGASTTRTAFRALPTNVAVHYLYSIVPKRNEPIAELSPTQRQEMRRMGMQTTMIRPLESHFLQVSHAILIILLALTGGMVGRFVYATRDKGEN